MKIKKTAAVFLALISVFSVFTACSKDEPVDNQPTVENITDADDSIKMEIDSDEETTADIVDNEGNTLTVVPVYDKDGSTVIAGYIEAAKDKSGKVLDEKAYPNLKKVIAMSVDEQKNFVIKYDENNKPLIINAMANDKGEIIALADALDLDKNKVTNEYFEAVTIIDNNGNIFIKLKKDDKDKYIKVEVKTDSTGKTTVTTNDGKSVAAKKTEQSTNLKDIADKKASDNKKPSSTAKPTSANTNKPTPTKPADDKPTPTKPEEIPEYYTITLGSGTDYSTDADNVEGKTNASGSYEVKIDGPGKANKYIVTSKPNTTFTGKLEFQLNTTDEIEVKIINANISANAKTAVKFANLDRVVNKGNDAEGDVSSEGSDVGTAVDVPAPKVELSFPEGTTSTIKANGSGNNGTIYSECKLGIKGYGKAVINGGQSLSGICCTESVKIKNVELDIESAAKQGISCDKKVTIESGTVYTHTKGDGIHCNKFEMYDGNVNLKSLYTIDCCDGIDANDYVIISGGNLNIEALTSGKFSIKVRKVIKENPKGYIQIDGGTISASGGQGHKQPITGAQADKSAFVVCTKPTQFTVGGHQSSDGSTSFICSPTGATQATISYNNQTKNLAPRYGFGGYYNFLVK